MDVERGVLYVHYLLGMYQTCEEDRIGNEMKGESGRTKGGELPRKRGREGGKVGRKYLLFHSLDTNIVLSVLLVNNRIQEIDLYCQV